MSASFAFAIYFICWWVVLFTILPLKIGPQPKEGERDYYAEASGAPLAPNLGLKFLVTTIVSAAVFGVIYVLVVFEIVRFDNLPF